MARACGCVGWLTRGQSLRLYDVASNVQKAKFEHRAAVMDCAFSDGGHAFSGGLDMWVRGCVRGRAACGAG